MLFENRIKEIDELKKQIDKHRPLKKEQVEKLKEYYRIGLTYSSNALEGNSLTETETKVVIEDGITIGGKPIKDHYEAMGHSEAFDLLYGLAKTNKITEKNILELHRLFYYRIDAQSAGKYRKVKVLISGTEFTPPFPLQVPALMKKFAAQIALKRRKLHPVEFAAWLHKELVTIHPFKDGNGRTARLLMNLALLQSGYCITVIPPVVRAEYINVLKKAQVPPQSDQPFINFISCMVAEAMNDFLRLLTAI
ncbi:MAG TPA: Fic family protein [Candidatus Omnitrophota bacterium]|nr:Fic family protein [Candidatus Omnitrophota bacterium]